MSPENEASDGAPVKRYVPQITTKPCATFSTAELLHRDKNYIQWVHASTLSDLVTVSSTVLPRRGGHTLAGQNLEEWQTLAHKKNFDALFLSCSNDLDVMTLAPNDRK